VNRLRGVVGTEKRGPYARECADRLRFLRSRGGSGLGIGAETVLARTSIESEVRTATTATSSSCSSHGSVCQQPPPFSGRPLVGCASSRLDALRDISVTFLRRRDCWLMEGDLWQTDCSPPVMSMAWSGSDSMPRLDGSHALVVDDHADTADFFCTLLRVCGASCTPSTSARAAARAMRVKRPDILLSSLDLPDDDLRLLAAAIWHFDIPAIAVSRRSRKADRETAQIVGYREYLLKPVDPSELCEAVARVIAKASGGARE
jgi:CheY-like chemotaxis protein